MSFESILSSFGVSRERGFLPTRDPLDRLPSDYDHWECLARYLPKLLVTDQTRTLIEDLPPFRSHLLASEEQVKRAMVVLSYLGHAYVWCGEQPATRLPEVIAVPWHNVATKLGRPPILSYGSYCLDNWFRFDKNRPPVLGNIGLIQNFLAGEDEEWFILIHVDIEYRAATALALLHETRKAVEMQDHTAVADRLQSIGQALEAMYATMERMPERCDPYIYYRRVRPYIHGWRNHPDMPDGLIYEEVQEYSGQPQQFRGETGAQSGIIPALDAFLGVEHGNDVLKDYLMEMRSYMPPKHRAFVESLEGSPLRQFVESSSKEDLKEAYNACVAGVEKFRALHLAYAAQYIFRQAQEGPKNPVDVGTGGTPFMKYLEKHRAETADHCLTG